MDQLYTNDTPAFTTWVVENDLLKEPFVVIDVGVQGGPHRRWKHLKDKIRVYGFDAIPEVVEGLNAQVSPALVAQVRETGLLKPPTAAALTITLAEPPGARVTL